MTIRLLAPAVLVFAVVIGLAVTAGGDATSSGPPLPDLSIERLDVDGQFALASLADAERPTLLGFWAPWCGTCNHEAPAIGQLAAEAGDELTVVAIGGRDLPASGRAFVERHALRTPIVLFDEPLEVWSAYTIPGQPAGVLLDRRGREHGRWLGAFDPAEVLAVARAL